jgi:Pyridine nucleotide-disulphide oxidoreductase
MCSIAIIGAGPYGLSAAAHLNAAGVDTRVFGEPMGFWQHQMPVGMLLRSPWAGSHIADPSRALTLDRYEVVRGERLPRTIRLEDFVSYGKWFQLQSAHDVDRRLVTRLDSSTNCFRLTLDDGEPVHARRVVIATGLAEFPVRPPPFDVLPRSLTSHSSEHNDLKRFASQCVLVIGAGQSALESAALLHETGATVEVVARAPTVHFLRQGTRRHQWLHSRANPFRPLLFPPGAIGPPVLNWIIETPDLFRRLPQQLGDRIAERGIRPAAAGWLRQRLVDVPITTGRFVTGAEQAGQRLRVTLDDQSTREVDHILLATGYRVDITKYPWIEPELVNSVLTINGSPILSSGFETSVPGLHFLGAPAAESFGPLMRFVAGTGYAARALTEFVVRSESASASVKVANGSAHASLKEFQKG